jgi:hypothetical protein
VSSRPIWSLYQDPVTKHKKKERQERERERERKKERKEKISRAYATGVKLNKSWIKTIISLR